MTIFEHVRQKVAPRAIVFEIGACWGADTERLIEVLDRPTYYAFEPDPRNMPKLMARRLPILAYPFAFGAKNKVSQFNLSSGRRPGRTHEHTFSSSLRQPKNHLVQHPWCKFETRVQVEVKTLDAFCPEQGIGNIDFIWMDVQGAEEDVIRGGKGILEKTKLLYTEYSNEEEYEGQPSLAEIMNLLGENWRIVEQYEFDVLLENWG